MKSSTTGRLTGLTPAIVPKAPAPTSASATPNLRAAVTQAYQQETSRPGYTQTAARAGGGAVESALTSGGRLASQGINAASNVVTGVRNALSGAVGLGGGNTARAAGGGIPAGTAISPAGMVPAQVQQAGGNFLKDLVNLPAEVAPSTYFTAKAALSAVEGHPQALEQMGKQTLQALTTAKGWEQHPLNNALMVAGGLSAATRGLAAVKSAAGLSDSSVLARPDEELYGNARTPRLPYSRDPVIRMRQKIADSHTPAVERNVPLPAPKTFAGKVAQKVDEAYGTSATVWRNERQRIIQERQDAITAKHTPVAQARQLGAYARNPLRPLLKPEIVGKEAVNLFAQGVLRGPKTIAEDAQRTIDMVQEHRFEQGSPQEKAQAETLSRLEAIKNDKQLQKHPQAAISAAHKFADDMAPLQKKLVDRGYVSQEAVDHAKLISYAVTHMGARHDVTAEALAHDATKEVVSDAQKRLNAAERSARDGAPGADSVVAARRADLATAQARERDAAVAQNERFGLVHPDTNGQRVTDEEIRAHMKANGVNPDRVAFITHRLGSDAQARWGKQTQQALADTKQRTGEAFRTGMTDISHDAVVRQHLQSALIAHRHDSTARLLNTFAVRKLGSGDFTTRDAALKATTDPEFRAAHKIPDGVKLEPIRLAPQFVRKAQLTAIKSGLTDPEELFDEAGQNKDITSHDWAPIAGGTVGSKDVQAGSFAVIPEDAASRLREHERPASTFMRGARGGASLFRQSVLPFSPHRVIGLPQETAVRLAIGRAGITSRVFAGRLLNTMSREDFQKANPAARNYLNDLTARALGGQQSAQALRMKIYAPRDYMRGTPMEGGVKLLANAKGKIGIGHVLAAFKATTNGILHWQRQAIEAQASKAALGKAALIQLKQETGYSWPRALFLHQKAVEDFAKGMIGSHNQDMFGRYVDRMMGSWSNYGPSYQRAVALSPFLPWYVNSLKFIYSTLPANHPVISGLMAASNTATQQQRAAIGESGPFSNNPLEVQGYEEGGVPTKGKLADLSYYSPFGAVSDVFGAPASEILPLGQPVLQALTGLDYTWRYPKNASGQRVEPPWSEKLTMGVDSLFSTILPGFSVTQKAISSPASLISPFRVYAPYPIQSQSTSLGGGSLGGGSLGGGSLGGGSLGG